MAHNNDFVHMVARRAVEFFVSDPTGHRIFSSANFSSAFCRMIGIKGPLDGLVVEAILCGRSDILRHGNAMWCIADDMPDCDPPPRAEEPPEPVPVRTSRGKRSK